MIEIFDRIHPLVLDVVVVAVLVLIAFFGVIKGVKKTIIDLVIVVASLFLGFCPWTNSVKMLFVEAFFSANKVLPAGSVTALKFSYSLLTQLLAALAFALLIYILLHVIVALFGIIARRNRDNDGQKKSAVGRVFGGIISLIYGGVLMLVTLFSLNNNVSGMANLIEKSTVTKVVVEKTDQLITKKDDKLINRLVLKIYSGNFMAKIGDEAIEAFTYLDDNYNSIVENEKYVGVFEDDVLSQEEVVALTKDRIETVNKFSILTVYMGNDNDETKKKFAEFTEEIMTVINREIKESGIGKIEYPANDLGLIELNLEKAGASEKTRDLLREITIGK